MPNKMLIDASHPEETRVVVLRGNRVEEFDFESANKKQLRGNIYLAKVTRVEPSLQAAFVDYGGNRHGFLAFSEIHPDYYQIPVADRQALLEEEARAQRAEDEGETRVSRRRDRRHREGAAAVARRRSEPDEAVFESAPEATGGIAVEKGAGEREATEQAELPSQTDVEGTAESRASEPTRREPANEHSPVGESDSTDVVISPEAGAHGEGSAGEFRKHETEFEDDVASPGQVIAEDGAVAEDRSSDDEREQLPSETYREATAEGEDDTSRQAAGIAGEEPPGEDEGDLHARRGRESAGDDVGEDENGEEDDEAETQVVEQIGGDAMEEIPHRPPRLRRQYKIQEVIKRRQVLLVQVAKEERGTKGAALTTYLSLAGRYSVLMPNTARGGGISRKITNPADRKRLKAIAEELDVPEGMGIILRTAGASRTKAEVKRDFEYLLRMWETVREVTLKSTAPTLVYEEGSLIKRAIRDLYNKDIDEIIVAGEEGYREAKEFMRMLMPSHAKNVKLYKDIQPLFARAGAEAQLDAMFTNQVTLKSGGYIVINQTEALVAIDVNSGRATREHNIEDTALRTNLEAAEEIARQLRLRDLAGLIVVDFIDMEEPRNNRAVERRMKEALKNDRARIQIGRISHFGLLEMSRQRIRTGVLEGSTVLCPHCMGAGMVRSTSSIALHVLRGLEEALLKNAQYNLTVRTRTEVALYILNQKRLHLRELENRFGVTITVAADATLTGTTYFAIDRGDLATPQPEAGRELVRLDTVRPIYEEETTDASEFEEEEEEEVSSSDEAETEEQEARAELQGRPAGPEAMGEGDARRRRRRRRRRGRDRDARPVFHHDVGQPSDAGLAVVNEMVGTAPSMRHEAEPFPRTRRSEDASRSRLAEQGEAYQRSPEITARVDDHPKRQSEVEEGGEQAEQLLGTRAAPIPGEPATAPAVELSSETRHAPSLSPESAEAPVAPDAGEKIEPTEARANEEPVETEPFENPNEPQRPKKSGWWQRAKATFGS